MKASEVMRILNISRSTLCQYVKQKKILHNINKFNGRYSYIPSSVYKLISDDPRSNIIYTRVSTYKQKSQLSNQIDKIKKYCIENSIEISTIYKDISSGLSLNRKNFNILLDDVLQYKIKNILITNKDRLSRLSFRTIKQLFEKYGTTIICINEFDEQSEEEELLEELISLIHCFSMKSYSKRRKSKYTLIKKDLNLEKIDK